MDSYLNMAWVAVAVMSSIIVFVTCIHRMNLLDWDTNKWGYMLSYMGFILFAVSTSFEAVKEKAVDWHSAFGLACIALLMLSTSNRWKFEAPEDSKK